VDGGNHPVTPLSRVPPNPAVARPALAAERALTVFEVLAEAPEPMTLAEIARQTGVNPASAHALLAVLTRTGYLRRHPVRRSYELGPALAVVGTAALARQPAVEAARAEVGSLSAELGAEVVLTASTGEDILVLETGGHASPFGPVLRPGQRLPLRPPLGSVFLAWSDGAAVEEWLARADPPLSGGEAAEHRAVLAGVRTRGYALAVESPARVGLARAVAGRRRRVDRAPAGPGTVEDLLSELSHGPYQLAALESGLRYDVSLISAPIFDADRGVVAALSVSGLSPAQSAEAVSALAERLRGAALVVTKRTGGRPPRAPRREGTT